MKDKTRKYRLIHTTKKEAQLVALKVGRNDPCPCGSGKKAKNCCGAETQYRQKSRSK